MLISKIFAIIKVKYCCKALEMLFAFLRYSYEKRFNYSFDYFKDGRNFKLKVYQKIFCYKFFRKI